MIKEQFFAKDFVKPELASVKLLQRARKEYGEVPNVTWQRIKDEETSLIAEGLRGDLNVFFDYQNVEGQLTAVDGQSFMEIAKNGLEYTEQQFYKDARYQFALTRAIYEYREAELAEKLANGDIDAQTIITISPYPQEAADKYGESFVQMLGAQPKRKLGMIRAIEKTPCGIRMYTRGVEESDLHIWNSILPLGQRANNTDEMLGKPFISSRPAVTVLDDLQNQYLRASNQNKHSKHSKDIWDFLQSQHEYKNHFFNELDRLSQTNLTDDVLLLQLNNLRYNFWSSLRIKFDEFNQGSKTINNKSIEQIFSISGQTMIQNREVFASCGMSIAPIEQLSNQQMAKEIFGDIMSCVTCPFCKKIVDARLDKSRGTIQCLNKLCGAKVDQKGQRIDNKKLKKEKSFSELLADIFESLFAETKAKPKIDKSKS